MIKLFVIVDDNDPFLSVDSFIFVETEEQAKALLKTNPNNMYYMGVETLSDADIKDMICDVRFRKIDNPNKFYEKYCTKCTVKYNEDCPYLKEEDDIK